MKGRRLLDFAGTTLAVIAIVWLSSELIRNAESFPEFGTAAFGILTIAIFLYAVQAIISGGVWCHLLRVVGEPRVQLLSAISINCLSQAGKYIPGNVAHYISRVALSRKAGWGTVNTLFTIFIETLWSAAVAAALALLGGLLVAEQRSAVLQQIPQWQMLAALVIGASLAPLAGHRIFEFLAQRWYRSRNLSLRAMHLPPIRSFCLAVGVYLINYLLMGWVLSLIAIGVFDVPAENILLLAGIYAAAWITGFVTPGAPAGLGIREAILVAALAPLYPVHIAAGLALTLRGVTIAGDGLVFLIGLGINRVSAIDEDRD